MQQEEAKESENINLIVDQNNQVIENNDNNQQNIDINNNANKNEVLFI